MLETQQSSVDVICDLREFGLDVTNVGTMRFVWQQAADLLIGKTLEPGKRVDVQLPEGKLALWVVESRRSEQVCQDTVFSIIDVLRNPTLLYRCRVCGKYGPLRCVKCEKTDPSLRLCSNCANFIEDELAAYCSDHVPQCDCVSRCGRTANVRCGRCHRLFNEHVRRRHPRDMDVDYCDRCFRILFEQCDTCQTQGRPRPFLGKSRCAFKDTAMEGNCNKALCWEHSYQWKIWGPHNRGVTLCERHKLLLGNCQPSDLLYMMVTAKPPFTKRGKRQSLPNPFRLRRIINRNRASPLTFEQLGNALRQISGQVEGWGRYAQDNYNYLALSFRNKVGELSKIEAELLIKVRTFYHRNVNWDAAALVAGVEITDQYFKPGQPGIYRVRIRLNTNDKRHFIGRNGVTINQLQEQLNIKADL